MKLPKGVNHAIFESKYLSWFCDLCNKVIENSYTHYKFHKYGKKEQE